jgi:hypothetical protein
MDIFPQLYLPFQFGPENKIDPGDSLRSEGFLLFIIGEESETVLVQVFSKTARDEVLPLAAGGSTMAVGSGLLYGWHRLANTEIELSGWYGIIYIQPGINIRFDFLYFAHGLLLNTTNTPVRHWFNCRNPAQG